MQNTSTILMIRPSAFAYNNETAASNAFQRRSAAPQNVQETALTEFDTLVETLRVNNVDVIVVEDTRTPHTPDAIFPNNWISTHANGDIFLYPMEAENRRLERRSDLLELLQRRFNKVRIHDLSHYEKQGKFLEGTGSMVLDRDNKIAYACLSSRTNPEVLENFAKLSGYRLITFYASDQNGQAVYHTNVMMCMGEKFAVICLDSIRDQTEKTLVVESLLATGKEIIQISIEQMNQFAGNMLEITNKNNEKLLILSDRAFHSLSRAQVMQLEKYCKVLHSPLETIETNGGGSARCMMAEIFLPAQ